MNDLMIKIFEKWGKGIVCSIKGIIICLMLIYTGFFINLGIDIIKTSPNYSFNTILLGLIGIVLGIIFFIVTHFASESAIDFKLVGLFLGLAVGGGCIGLIGGYYNNLLSWIAGGLAGILIIWLTVNWYFSKK